MYGILKTRETAINLLNKFEWMDDKTKTKLVRPCIRSQHLSKYSIVVWVHNSYFSSSRFSIPVICISVSKNITAYWSLLFGLLNGCFKTGFDEISRGWFKQCSACFILLNAIFFETRIRFPLSF